MMEAQVRSQEQLAADCKAALVALVAACSKLRRMNVVPDEVTMTEMTNEVRAHIACAEMLLSGLEPISLEK